MGFPDGARQKSAAGIAKDSNAWPDGCVMFWIWIKEEGFYFTSTKCGLDHARFP